MLTTRNPPVAHARASSSPRIQTPILYSIMKRLLAISPGLIASILLLRVPASGHAQNPKDSAARGPLSSTMVEASSRRVRITFPIDTAGAWAWPLRKAGEASDGYVWSAHVDGMDGPWSLGVWVFPKDSAALT